jgi:polysaccharide deacetylase family protein (PEP-CTERM system associated)
LQRSIISAAEKKPGINILSIDIEDWFLSYDSSQIGYDMWPELESRVGQNTRSILKLLANHNQKATFFILGWIAERHQELIKEISKAGHEIGYHSYYHAMPVNQGMEAFEVDLVKGLDLLRKITGKPVKLYRAPMFSLCNASAWTIPILLKHGITMSSSYKSHHPFNDHRIPSTPFYFEHEGNKLMELPLNRMKVPFFNLVYTGSGYFRVLPLWLINRLFDRNAYNMTYFHPRDFDEQVPFTNLLPVYRNWMNRLGNRSTSAKLEALLSSRTFLTVGEAAVQLKKDKLAVVKV